MIKRIELWNFESHEHTVIDDISPALNLLCGESNSGKTSIVRALKLAAYNEFDPRSVRVGATKCVVQVDTERGRVKVTRGAKDNLWEVTKIGQTTQYFDKVGKNIVPEAEAIIGLKIVTLGDVAVPVNIMDQLESHFMLKGIGDKDASGSMRAQIVDEISGLSGIEGLIKDVSLDHHRFGREIKETEKTMEAVRLQLHPEAVLKAEEKVLDEADKDLKDHDTMLDFVEKGDTIVSEASSVRQGILLSDRSLAAIPDTEAAIKEVTRAEEAGTKASSASQLNQAGMTVKASVGDLTRKLAVIPDTLTATDELSRADDFAKVSEAAEAMSSTGIATKASIVDIETKLDEIPDCQTASTFINKADLSWSRQRLMEGVQGDWTDTWQKFVVKTECKNAIDGKLPSLDHIKRASEMVEMLTGAEALLRNAKGIMSGMMDVKQKIADYTVSVAGAEKQRDELLASVTTCPLTLKPISKECLQ